MGFHCPVKEQMVAGGAFLDMGQPHQRKVREGSQTRGEAGTGEGNSQPAPSAVVGGGLLAPFAEEEVKAI